MAIIRTTRFEVASERVDEMLARRGALIAAVRAAYPGLADTRLARVDDRTWVDTWRWDSEADLQRVLGAAGSMPEAGAAFALAENTRLDVEQATVVDER